MRVLLNYSWKLTKADTLGQILRRVFAAADAAGFPAPDMSLVASDSPVGGTSGVERVVKQLPDLAPLRTSQPLLGSTTPVPTLVAQGWNGLSRDILLALADGVPRRWPLHSVQVHLSWPEFGSESTLGPGIHIHDQWWINGRMRALTARIVAEADPAAKKLPPLPPGLADLVAELGKPSKVTNLAIPGGDSVGAPAEIAQIVARHRTAPLPALPHALAARPGTPAGPMKPLLEKAFPAYSCKGGQGTFTLRRRTAKNLIAELSLDVGTWSHNFTGVLSVHAPAFRATLPLRVGGAHSVGIAGPDGWRSIVENLAVLVAHFEAGFVTDIVNAADLAPEWFEPFQ